MLDSLFDGKWIDNGKLPTFADLCRAREMALGMVHPAGVPQCANLQSRTLSAHDGLGVVYDVLLLECWQQRSSYTVFVLVSQPGLFRAGSCSLQQALQACSV